MLSESLIQFSVDVPSLLFVLRPTMVEVMKIMVTSVKRSHAHSAAHSAPSSAAATTDPRLHHGLLDSHGQVWVSLLWGHCSFLLGSGSHKILFVPSKRWLYDGVNGDLLQEGLCHTQVYCSQSLCLCSRPLLTCTSIGDSQHSYVSFSVGSLGSQFSSVQSLSHVQLFTTPWTAAHQASLSITNSCSLPKLMSIESVMPSKHLTLCHPFLILSSIFPSIRVFSNESALHIRWPKYCSFSFSISPSNEHPGLISFRMDWLDLLTVQGTLKSLLQHHSSKASILRCSAFLTVQLSYPYMTTGKTIALTRWTFVGKVMSLLFTMLSRLVITFPRSKRLNFMAADTICSDFGAQKSNVSHCFHCFPIYLPWSDGARCHDLSFLNVEF